MNKEDKIPKRIHIVGIYGSGKSSLAKKISELLKIKSYDLDDIKFKRKYDIIRPEKERLAIVKQISRKKSWITEGAWLDNALPLYKTADLVIFLEIPEHKLYWRIFLRHFKRKLNKKEFEKHTLRGTFSIMSKVKKYFHDPKHFMTLSSHKERLDKYAKKTFIIKNNQDIKQLLESLT